MALCLALLLGTLAGCASSAGGPLPSPSPMGPGALGTPTPLNSAMPEDTAAPGAVPQTTGAMVMLTPAQAQQAAQRISDEAAKLSEVGRATAVVLGNTALVGVEFDAQYKGDMTTRIKDMVTDRAKQAEPAIQRVAVSADPDVVQRVRAMAESTQGNNAADISAEFTEIVNRIMPR
jgi:YhcN/YlaJ family sporulation lipoprotein